MDDTVYGAVRAALSRGMNEVVPSACSQPEDMDCNCRGCAVRSAMPLRRGENADRWAQEMNRQKDCFGSLYGVPLVKEVRARGGHVLFFLTDAFYDALIVHSITSLTPSGEPKESDPVFYGLQRMRMLARQGGEGCPPQQAIQNALWRTFALEETDEKRGRNRCRREAADALIKMFDGFAPLQRHCLRCRCGQLGEAAARILSYYSEL